MNRQSRYQRPLGPIVEPRRLAGAYLFEVPQVLKSAR